MPNQNILINAIMINEAKTSSSIENIVTTHDEIYKAMIKVKDASPAAKEVADYRAAIWTGFNLVKMKQIVNTNMIVKIQEKLEHNQAGIRTTMRNSYKKYFNRRSCIYTASRKRRDT